MHRLITKTGDFKLNNLLSGNFPFLVYDAINKMGKRVVVKKLFEPNDTLSTFKDSYHVFHGFDLRTSAWYGHKKASIQEIKGSELLIEQFNYLLISGLEYNLSNCSLEYDLNNQPLLIYDFIEGDNLLESKIAEKCDLFLRMIPSLLKAVSNYPHGDLSFTNLIIHKDKNKFSIIDPAVRSGKLFFTNTEFYPLVPPLFFPIKNGYTNFADQLAIGLMLYKLLTGNNPMDKFLIIPFWAKESGFGNPIGGCIPEDIYSVISTLPESWEVIFNSNEYINAVRGQLKIYSSDEIDGKNEFIHWTGIKNFQIDFPSDFFNIAAPYLLNKDISKELSDFCMSLIFNYEPINWYIDKIQQLTAHNRQ
jgi:hypothetical protein